MNSDLDRNRNPSFFPFERLPVEIQSQILSLLPITTLVVCKLVSRSWRSLISSPIFTASYRRRRDDLIFLLWRHVHNPSFFPFERLPVEIQSQILSLLPITTLVVCKAVSRSWRSIISSPAFTGSYRRRPDDLIFLLWRSLRNPTSVSAYLPSDDRWLNFHLPASYNIRASGAFLLLSDYHQDHFTVVDPFSRTPVFFFPFLGYRHKVLALIQDTDTDTPYDYMILAVSDHVDYLHFWIYGSRLGEWVYYPELAQHYSSLKNAVYLDGLIFCLSRSPDRILTLDPVTTHWATLDLAMPVPDLMCVHLLVFEGEVYLTGVLWDHTQFSAIGIWRLDRSAVAWSNFAFMPEEYLAEFISGGVKDFHVVDCMGIICYCNLMSTVMCDMAARRWWRTQLCDVPVSWKNWLGHAIEPYVGLLKCFGEQQQEKYAI